MIRLQLQKYISLRSLLNTTNPFWLLIILLNCVKVMFPDSKIAEKFASGRTKTTAIVKYVLAPLLNYKVVEFCCTSPFTILCDGGLV